MEEAGEVGAGQADKIVLLFICSSTLLYFYNYLTFPKIHLATLDDGQKHRQCCKGRRRLRLLAYFELAGMLPQQGQL